MPLFPRSLALTRIYNRLQFGSAFGLAVGFVLLFAIITDVNGTRLTRLSDFFYQSIPPSGQVVVVAIDDASIEQLGNLPWSPGTLAQLIDRIAQAQPSVIGIDVSVALDASPNTGELERALQHAAMIVQPIIGVDATRLTAAPNTFPRYGVALMPTNLPQTGNTQLGHITLIPDADGIVRRIPLAIEAAGKRYPALGMTVLAAHQRKSSTLALANNQASFGTLDLPVNPQGQMLLQFASPNSARIFSAAHILREPPAPQLRGKMVLIGVTGTGYTAHYQTPVSNTAPTSGILLQADLIETLLAQRFLMPQDRLTQIVMVFLLALLAGATLPHFRFLPALGLDLLYTLLYLGYAFAEFEQGAIVQPLYPLIALLLMLIGTTTYRYFSEVRHREFLTGLMRRYLAPDAVHQAAEKFDRDAVPMRGVARQVSVLAIDLSELEPLASSLTAEAMMRLLNEYADVLLKIIFAHRGSVVKQTGSAILAAWNLLIDQPDHAAAAVRAAIDIRHTVADFNRQHPKELTIRTGMGIATGKVVAGRLGNASLTEYTIIGEIVGMAERIALKPERGVFIDITTRELLGEEFDMLEVKPVRLRRKSDPSHVWLLVEPSETQEELAPIPIESQAPK